MPIIITAAFVRKRPNISAYHIGWCIVPTPKHVNRTRSAGGRCEYLPTNIVCHYVPGFADFCCCCCCVFCTLFLRLLLVFCLLPLSMCIIFTSMIQHIDWLVLLLCVHSGLNTSLCPYGISSSVLNSAQQFVHDAKRERKRD